MKLHISIMFAFMLAVAVAGAPPKEWCDLDGRALTVSPSGDAKAHVFFFVLADCPVAKAYSQEIQRIADDYAAKGIRSFLVHVDPDTTAAQARTHASEFGLKLPVLLDPKRELVRFTGVTIAPEAAVILPGQKVAYHGRIDDLYADYGKRRAAPTQHTLRDALEAVLADKPIVQTMTKAIGCYIGAEW